VWTNFKQVVNGAEPFPDVSEKDMMMKEDSESY
jgi:hypothetical protein